MVMKYRMHPFYLPLFDVVRMRIRQIKQPPGKMSHNGMFIYCKGHHGKYEPGIWCAEL